MYLGNGNKKFGTLEFFQIMTVVKSLPLLNVTDIMAGKFHSERNGPVYFVNSTIFDNTDIVISTNRVGGNHWTFVAIEIKNACFVYMSPKRRPIH